MPATAANGPLGPVALVSSTAESRAVLYLVALVEQLNERVRSLALLRRPARQETRTRLGGAGAEVRTIEGLRGGRRRRGPAARTRAAPTPARAPHVDLAYQADGLTVLSASLLHRGPMIATLHLVVPGRARWREWVAGRTLRRYRCAIAVSEAVERYLRRRGVEATRVLNGLPPTEPRPGPTRGARPRRGSVRGRRAGSAGCTSRRAGTCYCRAAPIVHRELPDAVFAVVGDGPGRGGAGQRAGVLGGALRRLPLAGRFLDPGLRCAGGAFRATRVSASCRWRTVPRRADRRDPHRGPERSARRLRCPLCPRTDPEALAAGILRAASDAELRADLGSQRARAGRPALLQPRRQSAEETLAVYRSAADEESSINVALLLGYAVVFAAAAFWYLVRLERSGQSVKTVLLLLWLLVIESALYENPNLVATRCPTRASAPTRSRTSATSSTTRSRFG